MMTEFYQEDYRIRSVRIGEQSSLPGLEGLANVQQNTKAVLDEDDEIFLGYGFRSNVFPYRPQDVYTREQTERCYRSIVLENEFLRARFLPELGGRLISLTDKASGRDLLYQNKTLYAGNLAMRNSWFSGGVEWNASIIGHNPFTCSPLFAARTQLADGTPVLRMYEYERLRGVSFQMDFFLPDSSRVLFARMRLVNENAQTVPTYWWSNIAVPEWRGGRVVVPADAAYVARDGVIFKDSVPVDRDLPGEQSEGGRPFLEDRAGAAEVYRASERGRLGPGAGLDAPPARAEAVRLGPDARKRAVAGVFVRKPARPLYRNSGGACADAV